ncbi:hypothetical protein U1Q18_032695 [Sarracenia purpurea var. burkii]
MATMIRVLLRLMGKNAGDTRSGCSRVLRDPPLAAPAIAKRSCPETILEEANRFCKSLLSLTDLSKSEAMAIRWVAKTIADEVSILRKEASDSAAEGGESLVEVTFLAAEQGKTEIRAESQNMKGDVGGDVEEDGSVNVDICRSGEKVAKREGEDSAASATVAKIASLGDSGEDESRSGTDEEYDNGDESSDTGEDFSSGKSSSEQEGSEREIDLGENEQNEQRSFSPQLQVPSEIDSLGHNSVSVVVYAKALEPDCMGGNKLYQAVVSEASSGYALNMLDELPLPKQEIED